MRVQGEESELLLMKLVLLRVVVLPQLEVTETVGVLLSAVLLSQLDVTKLDSVVHCAGVTTDVA